MQAIQPDNEVAPSHLIFISDVPRDLNYCQQHVYVEAKPTAATTDVDVVNLLVIAVSGEDEREGRGGKRGRG